MSVSLAWFRWPLAFFSQRRSRLPDGPKPAARTSRLRADLFDHVDVANDEVAQAAPQLETPTPRERSSSGSALCIAGRTPIDQAACTILAQLVEREHVTARVIGSEALSISGPSRVNPDGVGALCIFYLGRQSLAVVRYSVRRLRKRFPGVSVDLAPTVEAAQADATISSLKEAVAFCTKTETPRRVQQTPPEAALAPTVGLNLGPEKLVGI